MTGVPSESSGYKRKPFPEQRELGRAETNKNA